MLPARREDEWGDTDLSTMKLEGHLLPDSVDNDIGGMATHPSIGRAPPSGSNDELLQVREKLIGAYMMIRELRRKSLALEDTIVELRRVALTDELTGLRNRRAFSDLLERSISFSFRQQIPLSMVLLDVDHFKAFNDTFGHSAGDEVLRIVARNLQQSTRKHDIVARYGGEEFAILLPGTGRKDAVLLAERVRILLERWEWAMRPITASFGVSTLWPSSNPGQELSASTVLLKEADFAMYHSKQQGRNRVSHLEDLVNSGELRGKWTDTGRSPFVAENPPSLGVASTKKDCVGIAVEDGESGLGL